MGHSNHYCVRVVPSLFFISGTYGTLFAKKYKNIYTNKARNKYNLSKIMNLIPAYINKTYKIIYMKF
ncbi:hypothetical protein LEPN108286_12410 [Legionella pneumophila subsp. pneumophila]|nr:Uncharacterised protein [Legionella pneumophila]VEH37452.1 Uncharacterised protein [Legionella sainthelensi]